MSGADWNCGQHVIYLNSFTVTNFMSKFAANVFEWSSVGHSLSITLNSAKPSMPCPMQNCDWVYLWRVFHVVTIPRAAALVGGTGQGIGQVVGLVAVAGRRPQVADGRRRDHTDGLHLHQYRTHWNWMIFTRSSSDRSAWSQLETRGEINLPKLDNPTGFCFLLFLLEIEAWQVIFYKDFILGLKLTLIGPNLTRSTPDSFYFA